MSKSTKPDSSKPEQAEGLALILERNHFYRDRYRVQLRVSAGILILALLLAAILGWLITHPEEPRYFATTRTGELIALAPLSRPNKTDDAISQWAADIARKSYTFDFIHWKTQISDLSIFFTRNGYNEFLTALNESGNVEAVRKKRLVGNAIASPPAITQEGVLNGRYTWQIEVPLRVSYISSEETVQQSLLVIMTIVRADTLINEHGLAVDQFLTSVRR